METRNVEIRLHRWILETSTVVVAVPALWDNLTIGRRQDEIVDEIRERVRRGQLTLDPVVDPDRCLEQVTELPLGTPTEGPCFVFDPDAEEDS